VRQPIDGHFVRAHPDPEMSLEVGCIIWTPDEGKGFKEVYLVDPSMDLDQNGVALSDLPLHKTYHRVRLVAAISLTGGVFLWELKIPKGSFGREWHASREDLVEAAKKEWITVIPARNGVGYDFETPRDARGNPVRHKEPEWPKLTLEQLLELAFRDRFITSPDHHICKKMRGEV
jgi:hypothetical protein